MNRIDYSEWLTPERLAAEETLWADPTQRTWPHFVRAIGDVMLFTPVTSIVEFGCGTGWVPRELPAGVDYLGIDANQGCIDAARAKNPKTAFIRADVREVARIGLTPPLYDLACAFSFLKHFALDEWDDVLRRVVEHGRWATFSIPIADADRDDGTEFPHVWVTRERIVTALASTKHAIVGMNPLPWGETMVTTCQD